MGAEGRRFESGHSDQPPRHFIAPRDPARWTAQHGWNVDLAAVSIKVQQMRELVEKITDDKQVARAALLLLTSTMIGQNIVALELITGIDGTMVRRVRRGATAQGIWKDGHMVDTTEWWSARDGDAALILDALACLGAVVRTIEPDGKARYQKLAPDAGPARGTPRPPWDLAKPSAAPPATPVVVPTPRKNRDVPRHLQPDWKPPEEPAPAALAKREAVASAPSLDLLDTRHFRNIVEEEIENEPVQVAGLEEHSRERQAVMAAFNGARRRSEEPIDWYMAAVTAWLKIHPDHDRRAAAQRAAAIVLKDRWPEMLSLIRGRLHQIKI